jgi:hypothetical protein
LGPWRASQFARRAASSSTCIFGVNASSLAVLAKSKSSVVGEPMIPLVYEWLVDLFEERQTSMIPAPHV